MTEHAALCAFYLLPLPRVCITFQPTIVAERLTPNIPTYMLHRAMPSVFSTPSQLQK